MKVIVYSRPDGGITVVHPAPKRIAELMGGGMTEDEAIAVVQAKSVPADATNVEVMDRALIPASREFRDAWEKNGAGPPTVSMAKARDIHVSHIARAKMSAERALEVEEIELRLRDDIPAADVKAAALASVRGLDLATIATQIQGVANPTALSAVWPTELLGFRP